ncbi:hypothetical protein [Nesterenkonia sp.]|uniref:DUF6907 domain-containing protein n=1 Tax=Nesterenkonia sp. TaxID=704201 RepID=UPI002613E1BC|nr:hypothetical protein [Nesterenkonia sp.]
MSTTDAERPDWLNEPCPAWCHGDHSGQEFPEDRKHLRVQMLVPVILQGPAPRWWNIPGDVVVAEELLIAVYRRVGDRETWLAIANDSQNLEVSLESAARLSGKLAEVIEEVTGQPS